VYLDASRLCGEASRRSSGGRRCSVQPRRELLLGAVHRAAPPIETSFLEQMIALGWAVLAEQPGSDW